jgi:hypothetical protein
MATPLEQAITAARAGDTNQAQRLLRQILQVDRHNEQAWLWLSSVVATDEERSRCLHSVLAINPNNQSAQLGLKKLVASSPTTSLGPLRGEEQGSEAAHRRPFRLEPSAAGGDRDANGRPRAQPAANTLRLKTGPRPRRRPGPGHPRSAPIPGAQPRLPLLPVLIFGALSVTAIGGLLLMFIIALLA